MRPYKNTLLIQVIILCSISNLVIGQDWALNKLEASPRHQEWVEIKNGNRNLSCFLVFPEVKENTKVIIVLHENRGLNDWARNFADQIASAGYIAIAPDLLSGAAPNGGKTSDFASADEAKEAIYKLAPDQITADLNAVLEYAKTIPSANGKVDVIGFCWGGSQSFRYATNQTEIGAAYVCYGKGPENSNDIGRIKAPVYGFYGEKDNRVNATINTSTALMLKMDKAYFPVVYARGGHGFFRSGEAPDADEGNKMARANAWKRLVKLLKQ